MKSHVRRVDWTVSVLALANRCQPAALARLFDNERVTGYLFILPWLVGLVAFTAGPILASLYLSFTRYNVLQPAQWVGVGNYVQLLHDPLLFTALANTLFMVVVGLPLNIITAFGLALLLNRAVRGMQFYRTMFYMPAIVPGVANAVLWLWLLNPSLGLVNALLAVVHIAGPAWLVSPTWAKPGMVLMGMFSTGATMVIYLAGLQGVPAHLYEAAQIDGAGWWWRFWSVTFPMMTPTLFFTVIIGTIHTLQIFAQSYIMTQGGPVNSTLFVVYYLFNNAFAYFKMGYASAIAWLLFLLILLLTAVQLYGAPRWVHYEGDIKR
ncbi:MAG: sugar ABC transporter permease [Chloroflexi bacterium]|nr:sugar ABC transporter permease [Chloroflexota bacterium]